MKSAIAKAVACASDLAYGEVAGRAETIKSDAAREIEVMDVGDELRQGDLYVTRIDVLPGTPNASPSRTTRWHRAPRRAAATRYGRSMA